MADDRVVSEIVTKFFLDTCQLRQQMNEDSIAAVTECAIIATTRSDDVEADYIPLTTGSAAEFYIRPMFSCVGDVDIMFHCSDQLAIPAGTAPPTQLPAEFHSRVSVCEIIDSTFPGYVYLVTSYLLTECVDDGKYNAVQDTLGFMSCAGLVRDDSRVGLHVRHGPAVASHFSRTRNSVNDFVLVNGSISSTDIVPCIRCLSWPSQAADWPSRHREYGWPDSATVDRVVSNGCDVVNVAHPVCKQDEWNSNYQWRLSFSRAEIVLLNSWMPVQQIVYHLSLIHI